MIHGLWKRKDIFILFCIIALGLALRLYKLPQMVGFDFDQEYAAQFAQTVLQVYPIQMIGQGLSVPGLFMGPWYFYYLVPFFAFSHLDPIGGYIGSIILGLVTVGAYFFLLKPIFGTKIALLAAFFRSILFAKILNDWTMAPSYSSELAVLVTWYCLYKYWHKETKYIPLLAFVFGMYTSFHPILFPFYAVFLVFLLVKRKLPSLEQILLSLVLFVIPLLPLLLFEYYRHFLEVKTLFSLHASSKSEVKTFQTLVSYLLIFFRFPTSTFSIGLPDMINNIINAGIYIIICLLAIKRVGFWKDRFHIFILTVSLVIFLLYYFFLPTHVPGYYFLGIGVLVFISITILLGQLLQKKFAIVGIAIFLCIVLFNFSALWAEWHNPGAISLADKESVLLYIKTSQKTNTNFAVFTSSDPGQQFGMGYLERLYNINVSGNPTRTYEIVLPAIRATQKPAFVSASGNAAVIVHK